MNFRLILLKACVLVYLLYSLDTQAQDDNMFYKKRNLSATEIQMLTSYYKQDGNNAAVTGGEGSESLDNKVIQVELNLPLTQNAYLNLNMGISAYTSASSSNVDPFEWNAQDQRLDIESTDIYDASTGASYQDTWRGATLTYQQINPKNKQQKYGLGFSVAKEYDYESMGFQFHFSQAFNQKNTILGFSSKAFWDERRLIYPRELRPFTKGEIGLDDVLFSRYSITGNQQYAPLFSDITSTKKNTLQFSGYLEQLLSNNIRASLSTAVVRQEGILSSSFQRVYYKDIKDSFLGNFHLSEGLERLPNLRDQLSLTQQLSYYWSDFIFIKQQYQWYVDTWGIHSHSLQLEFPLQYNHQLSIVPQYRWYLQKSSNYFKPYNQHLSTQDYATSDYDLSTFIAHQFGVGIRYADLQNKSIAKLFDINSINLSYDYYYRNTGLYFWICNFSVGWKL